MEKLKLHRFGDFKSPKYPSGEKKTLAKMTPFWLSLGFPLLQNGAV
jgi:hypothetical protein